MNTSRQTIPIWGILSVALIPVTVFCAILATVTLDALVDRPGSVSMTTLLPGMAYSTALVMKVCIVEWVVSVVIALVSRARPRRLPGLALATTIATDDCQEHTMNISNTSRKIIPIWGILSVALTPLAPLFAALAVVIAQALVDKPEGVSMSYFPGVSRTGVLVKLACIAAGAVSAVIALVRRERPRSLPVLGLGTNAFLIGMFRYFEFYKLGFDQDRWAAP